MDLHIKVDLEAFHNTEDEHANSQYGPQQNLSSGFLTKRDSNQSP